MRVTLFVADDYQAMADGKLLAVGFYSDNVVVLKFPELLPEPLEVPVGIASLGLLITISDIAEGSYDISLKLLAPDGTPSLLQFSSAKFDILKGKSSNLIWKAQPLLVLQSGVYCVQAIINGDVVNLSFTVLFEKA